MKTMTNFEYCCVNEISNYFTEDDPGWVQSLQHFSAACVRMCFFSDPDTLNALSHVLHLYGFSPVCVRMCSDR